MFKCAILEDNGQDFQCPRSEQLTLQVANQPCSRQVLIIARFNTCSRLASSPVAWASVVLKIEDIHLWAAGFTIVTKNSKDKIKSSRISESRFQHGIWRIHCDGEAIVLNGKEAVYRSSGLKRSIRRAWKLLLALTAMILKGIRELFLILNHIYIYIAEQLRIARSCTVWEHFRNHPSWYQVVRNNTGFCQTASDTFGLPCTSLEIFATYPGVVEGLQNLGYPGDAARETGTGW